MSPPWLSQPTQVDSVPVLADTHVDTQGDEFSPHGLPAGKFGSSSTIGVGSATRSSSVHGRRVVLVPEPNGTPRSIQEMEEDDSVAAVSQWPILKTVICLRLRWFLQDIVCGAIQTQRVWLMELPLQAFTVWWRRSHQLMSFTTFEGTVWQSEKRSCLSMQSICAPFPEVVQERHEGGHGRSNADERGPPHPGMEVVPLAPQDVVAPSRTR